MITVLQDATISCMQNIWQIARLVIPIMIVLRFAKEYNVLSKISSYFEPLTKGMYLSKEATFPLIVGVVFGITYGAGVIIQSAEEGQITARDILLLNVFLGINHAVIEDTLIMAGAGASGVIIFISRTLLAIVVTYMLGKYMVYRERVKEKLMMSSE